MSDSPLISDGQDCEREPDVLTGLRELRPVRPDRFSAPQRFIERCLPVGAIVTEQSGGKVRVPLLPGAPEALKPGAELTVMAVRTQSARTVPRRLLERPDTLARHGHPQRATGRGHSPATALRCGSVRELEHRECSAPAPWHARETAVVPYASQAMPLVAQSEIQLAAPRAPAARRKEKRFAGRRSFR